MDARETALQRAHDHATRWLTSLSDRRVPAPASVEEVLRALGTDLPDGPSVPADVVDLLAIACEPGLTAIPSGRFYGFVAGGSEPAALAADWLVSAWDGTVALTEVRPCRAPSHLANGQITRASSAKASESRAPGGTSVPRS